MHGGRFVTGAEEIPGSCVNLLDLEDPAKQAWRTLCDGASDGGSHLDGIARTSVGLQLKQVALLRLELLPGDFARYAGELVRYLREQVTLFRGLVERGAHEEAGGSIAWGLERLEETAWDLDRLPLDVALATIDEAEAAISYGCGLLRALPLAA